MYCYGSYGDLILLGININISLLITCKNGPSIKDTRSSFAFILYLCKTFSRSIIIIYRKINNCMAYVEFEG